jgi:perosamine synthetase
MKKKKGWRFKNKEIEYLKEVLNSDFSALSNGSMNERLEKEFSKIHQQKYAVTANSGTSTLHMALDALGVGHGDEVIIPSLTVAMCGFAVWQCGATPVYADVDEDTFLIDPKDIEKKITKKTKAIMVVHLYGLICDMNKILKIAKKNKVNVIEDCAQCFLGKDSKNRISGTIGSIGSWSFENSKHISTGEGGIVTTNDKNLATRMRKFGGVGFKNLTANSGKVRIDRAKFQNPNWYRHDTLAYNYRLSEICAAVGLAQTEKLKNFVKKRIKAGNAYYKFLKDVKSKILTPQRVPVGFKHSYYTFAAKFEGEKLGVSWQQFRKKYINFGGDGIYAAWKTVGDEIIFDRAKRKGLYSGSMKLTNSYGHGDYPVAKKLQKKIMQFTTNQKNSSEIKKQVQALKKTILYFGKK